MDVGSIIKEGGAQVLRGTLKNFLKNVRDCFGEPRMAENELETHLIAFSHSMKQLSI